MLMIMRMNIEDENGEEDNNDNDDKDDDDHHFHTITCSNKKISSLTLNNVLCKPFIAGWLQRL